MSSHKKKNFPLKEDAEHFSFRSFNGRVQKQDRPLCTLNYRQLTFVYSVRENMG